MTKQTLSAIAVVIALMHCSFIVSKPGDRIPRRHPLKDTPYCLFDSYYYALECFSLAADDMDLMAQSLQETAQFELGFGMVVMYCEGPAIPVDIFRGYNITYLRLESNNFTEIPYQLLSSINSQMVDLELIEETYSSVDTTAPDVLLPFSEYLIQMTIQITNVRKIVSGTFTQYNNIQNLILDTNAIESIGLEFLGLGTLNNLYLQFNDISTIETGAFRDLKNLHLLDLYGNNISTLQEGALDGLDSINTIYLDINPFNCTCDLQWLKDWLNNRGLADSSGAYCSYPIEGHFNDYDFCNTTLNIQSV